MLPTGPRKTHCNMSAPSSPVHMETSESRTVSSPGHRGDNLHRQQPSVPYTETGRIRTSISDNVGVRYVDKQPDVRQDSSHGERSRVDYDYSNYAYVRASAVHHPVMKDKVLEYRAVGVQGADVMPDGAYLHLQWPSHRADRSREVGGHVNSHRQADGNLYHIASNRTVSYASSDELPSTIPVTATATVSRFLDPAPRWPIKHGSLEGAYRRQNGDIANTNLSSGTLYTSNSPYAGSEASLPDKSHDTMPRRLASPPVYYETPPHLRAAAADTCNSVELSPADSPTLVMHGQNYVEVSKPFEMADVYKYSARMRRAAGDGSDMRSTSSPHLTSHAREPQYRDLRPAPSPPYFPSRQYRKPVFDWVVQVLVFWLQMQ